MLRHVTNRRLFAASMLLLACSAGLVHGQNLPFNTWDTDIQGWTCGGWDDNGVIHSVSWDGTIDAAGSLTSGSLRIDSTYTNGGAFHIQTCQGLTDFNKYNALELDVYVAPGSPRSPNGDFGVLDVRLRTGNWDWPGVVVDFGAVTNTGWTHFAGNIPANTATNFVGVNLELNTSFTNDVVTNTIWVDNLTFIMPGIFNFFSSWNTDVQGWNCGSWNDAGVTNAVTWDGALDVSNNLASGSLKIEAAFTNGGACHVQTCSALADFSPYNALSLDVYVPVGATPTPNGDYGSIDVRLRTGNWEWPGVVVQLGVLTNTDWTHLQANIPATTATNFAGIDLEWTTTYADPALLNTIWVDDLVFIGFAAPPPAPSMLLEKSEPGLEIATSGSGDFSRKNIATVAALAPSLPWINYTAPVTYSMTINQSVQPGSAAADNQFAANIMLSGTASDTINPSPDWNEPNGLFMEAKPQTNGVIYVDVRYKTNAPGSHGDRFKSDGLLIQVTNTGLNSLLGTWALTLSNNIVWLNGPGNVSGQGTLPPDVPALFGPNLFALFGAQPYTFKDRNISLSRVHISGGTDFTAIVDQDFTTQTALDSGYVETKEEDPGGVHLKLTNTVWRASWTIPDTDFKLYSTPSLSPAAWALSPLAPIPVGARRAAFITSTNVSGAQYFFRLQK